MGMRTERKSNIELLRIFAMWGVVILHYNNSMMGGMNYADGINLIVLYIIESMCIPAVDLFVLISGYFLYENQKRVLIKPIRLVAQVALFRCSLYFFSVLFGNGEFSVRRLMESLIPANYFVVLYVTLYFVSPLINTAVREMPVNVLKRMLLISCIAFSVWPTLVDVLQDLTGNKWNGLSSIGLYGSQMGYTIVNFVLMYLIGAFMRRYGMDNRNEKRLVSYILLLAGCVLLLTIWSVIMVKAGVPPMEQSAWHYCNPIVVADAVLYFLLFQRMSIPYCKIVNRLAEGAFTVYLVHGVFLTRLDVERYVRENVLIMLMHMFISVALIYMLCYVIYKIYSFLIKPVGILLTGRFDFLTKDMAG